MIVEKRMIFSPEQAILSVVVGETGVGKTTEICQYVKELREADHPVVYISLDEDRLYNFKEFLEEVFGTSDKTLILETLNENFTKQENETNFRRYVFFIFMMLISKKDWITFEKQSIEMKLTTLMAEKKIEGADKFFKSILEKKNQVTGWTNIKNIENTEKFMDCREILLKQDLIIQRRLGEYKFKNGLTEEIIRNLII